MFTLTSTDVSDGAMATIGLIDNTAGCNGRNRSPQLNWGPAPPGTKSFVISLHDPDAPRKGGWWHWAVFNLPTTTDGLPSGEGEPSGTQLPAGAVQVINDSGARGYSGPCPPQGHGIHHYLITVHALSVAMLDLTADAAPQMVQRAITGKVIASAKLVFLFSR
jgi:Raf kinase inhibitor-like YbhB/YbcL family protein